MEKVTMLYNCHILRNHQLIKDDLWMQNGLIIDPATVSYICDESMDCRGCLISPGFIDLKMNGGFGVDFSNLHSCDPQSEINYVAKRLPESGVTTFCPTIVTSAPYVYEKILSRTKTRDNSMADGGASVLGFHLDGPFISPKKVGAHKPELVRKFDNGFDSLKETYHDLEHVRLITLAPELEGAEDVIRQLTKEGIKVSLGHSACTLADAERAMSAGASMVTHLFNAMPTFHHRDPSLVGLIATELPDDKTVFYSVIADGVHTHPAALRMAHRIAPDTLFLVTDGVAALGLNKEESTLGSTTVIVDGMTTGRCTVAGTDILSGSISSMIKCLHNFQNYTGCSTVYALEAATLRPALAMGISHRKGTLDYGADADLVLLRPDCSIVEATYIGGKEVYRKTPTLS